MFQNAFQPAANVRQMMFIESLEERHRENMPQLKVLFLIEVMIKPEATFGCWTWKRLQNTSLVNRCHYVFKTIDSDHIEFLKHKNEMNSENTGNRKQKFP